RHAPCWAGSRAQKQGRYRSDEGYQELEGHPTLPWIESERPANENYWAFRKSCGSQKEGPDGSGASGSEWEEGREEGLVLGRPEKAKKDIRDSSSSMAKGTARSGAPSPWRVRSQKQAGTQAS